MSLPCCRCCPTGSVAMLSTASKSTVATFTSASIGWCLSFPITTLSHTPIVRLGQGKLFRGKNLRKRTTGRCLRDECRPSCAIRDAARWTRGGTLRTLFRPNCTLNGERVVVPSYGEGTNAECIWRGALDYVCMFCFDYKI